jgi:hypothetical protein
LSALIVKEFPRSIFFTGKLVFEREKWYQRILHNETGYAIQRRLQFAALNCMVLPVRVFAASKAYRDFIPLITKWSEVSFASFGR